MPHNFCEACGAPSAENATFCTECGHEAGTPVPPAPYAAPPAPYAAPYAAPPAPYAAPPASTSKGNGTTAMVVIGLVLLLIAGGAGAYLLTRDRGDLAGVGEVFLVAADDPGEDPFSASVVTTTPPDPVRLRPDQLGAGAVRSVGGDAPGLYGGLSGQQVCDVEALAAALERDPERAVAWAGVLGVADAATHVETLTPLVLRADTRVTDHGYRAGTAQPRQAVLEAGTSVLVDGLGQPTVRCRSGSPLTPPLAQAAGVTWRGDRWPGFDPVAVVVVVPRQPVVDFVVVDLWVPGFFTKPPGPDGEEGVILIDDFCDLYPTLCVPPDLGDVITSIPDTPPPAAEPRPDEPTLGTGDVQVTLRWYSPADLDLAVTDPFGDRVSFGNTSVPSGGQLDVDSNGGCDGITSPVENVFWPTGVSPEGTYLIEVNYYGACPGGEGPQTYELTFRVGGQEATVQQVATAGTPQVWLIDDQLAQVTTGVLNTPGDQMTFEGQQGPGDTGGAATAPEEQPPSSDNDTRPAGPVESPLAFPVPGGAWLSWLGNSDLDRFGPAQGFSISVSPGDTFMAVGADQWALDLTGLEPGIGYTISIVAFNVNGTSDPVVLTVTPLALDVEPTPTPAPTAAEEAMETKEEYCNRIYPPPPSNPVENPQWTLCMHDPAQGEQIDTASLPVNVD